MTGDEQAVLDACTLVNASVRDTLLRLAEQRICQPRWSDQILTEVARTLQSKLGKTPGQTSRLLGELNTYFRDAWVLGHEPLVPLLRNDPKDRHVLAAAIHSRARVIVTFNLRDFPAVALDPWHIEAQHPDGFLLGIHRSFPRQVVRVLYEQAETIGRSVPSLLAKQQRALPQFARTVAIDLGTPI